MVEGGVVSVGKSLRGGGGRPAPAALWLYILNSAKRVISSAESGLLGLRPGGLCLPVGLPAKWIRKSFSSYQISYLFL